MGAFKKQPKELPIKQFRQSASQNITTSCLSSLLRGRCFYCPIISIIAYFFGYGSGWVVFGCLLGGWFLYKATFVGACYGIMDGAEANERLYQMLISHGAFLFGPSKPDE